MTLSSLFQKPAQTALISGGVADSIITSSPAILIGFMAGGIATGTLEGSADALYQFTIKNGSAAIISGISPASHVTRGINQVSSGIDCPDGITVTTAKRFTDEASGLANARFTVFYILK